MKAQKLFALAVFILSLALSAAFFIFNDNFKEAASLGLFGIFIINFVSSASLFLSAPSFFTVIQGGNMYSPILVALVSSVGSAGGDLVGFLFGISGRRLVNHKIHKKIWFKVISGYFRKYGSIIIFLLAFLPNPFFDSIGIIAGVFAYSPLKFFVLVLLGRFIRFFLLAKAGSLF